MVRQELEKLIHKTIPSFESIDGHSKLVPIYLSEEVCQDVTFRIAAVDVSQHINDPIARTHVHGSPEVYLAISEQKGDIVFEVNLDGESFLVESPAAIYIPAGLPHSFRTLTTKNKPCFFLGIFLDYVKGASSCIN